MAVTAGIGAAVIAAGSTVYSVHEQRATAEKAAANADALAAKQLEEANRISLPNTTATAATMQAAQQQAASAGGTIHSNQAPIGDNANAPRKTLLGS